MEISFKVGKFAVKLMEMEIIPRPHYLNHVVRLLDKGMMLFLVGQRRIGKSYILLQARDWIKSNIPDSNVISINKEIKEYDAIKNADDLYAYVKGLIVDGSRNYLLIDEVQDIADFQDALRSFYTEDCCQIIATGSNAYVLSTELSTRLSGRYIEIPVYGLSYKEFLIFHGLEDNEGSLRRYLKIGGLPGLKNFDIDVESEVLDYMGGVFNTIMLKDIVLRNDIRNVEFAQNLAAFVADNIGKLISPTSIYKYLKSQGTKISEGAVGMYLKYLCNAMLTNQVSRYDIHGKKLFEMIHKYYFSDHGLRNFLTGFNLTSSIEKVMENVVWLHLITQGYKVTVGMLRAGEIDFVAERGSERKYIQVAYLLANEETREREFGNLLKISDNYPKYVISMDPWTDGDNAFYGIHHYNLREFLMMDL